MTHIGQRVLDRLRAEDPDLARAAQVVLDSLTWGEGVEVITQEGVQQFLWYTLPRKFLCDHSERVELAAAAAVLLDRLSLSRYAQIARSKTTQEVLGAYARTDAQGLAAFRRAQDGSGIQPPDLDRFRWGAVMRPDEAAASHAVAVALERAIVAGELVPGARGWKESQRGVAARALDDAHPDIPGQSWRTAVLTERLAHWTSVRVEELARHRSAIANKLLHPVDPPPDVAERLDPFTWFLARVGDGVPATQTGNLGRDFVREVAAERGWWDFDLHGPPHTETDVWRIHLLHGLGRSTHALRRRGRTIALTRAGRAMAAEPSHAWRALIRALTDDNFRRAAYEARLLWLLASGGPVDHDELDVFTASILTDLGWRTGDRAPVLPGDVGYDTWITRSAFNLFGLEIEQGPWRSRTVELTDAGRVTALAFLREVATGPRRSVHA